MNPDARFFASPTELRAWFETHHTTERELWVGFWKAHTGQPGVDYLAAVDEALCFGWIDTTVRRLDDRRYAHRFTPRRKGSRWSDVNREKFERLRREGRLAPAGVKAFEDRTGDERAYSYEARRRSLPPELLRQFRRTASAYRFFSEQPPSYRRLAAHWVASAVQPATRERRFAELVRASAAGTRPRPFLVARADRTAADAAVSARRRRARPGALK
jgi:uncharacterized protein YdeI (YjbR/CyaY-like superfamily)